MAGRDLQIVEVKIATNISPEEIQERKRLVDTLVGKSFHLDILEQLKSKREKNEREGSKEQSIFLNES